ncbi:glycosyltransferase [Paraburkholderia phymatum]|uniref:Glycosyl transferase group 1 n=1 Tax=Paraburkholderia phymatum (strain DSM 17167 / CIP 108236 / LMG 21445 / STM815) TaxID=391038 RepID=B2JT24_PARP8|nr:glycosyltransferase [Paraburkholderia phymatum]ACC75727.1 glycosyl transferase group 1 [Paraburkholderia phymatum STM815]
MRILQVVYAPRLSGAEILAKGLAIQHREGGHEVCITSMQPQLADFDHSRSELSAANVLCDFPDSPLGRVGRLRHLWRCVRRFRPDIIIAHATLAALYVRLLPSVAPVVYVMHSGSNDFANPKLKWAERVLSRRAKVVVGVSPQNTRDYLREVGPHPYVTVIPNGVDLPRFENAASAPVTGDRRDSRQIVQLGRYVVDKGQLETIQAFEIVLQHEPDARLVFYGVIEDQAYHDKAMSLVHRLNLAGRVTLCGPESNVAAILQASQVFAMPSHREAHSIGFLEALASGIPVVASQIAAFEFARDFAGVSLVDTNNTPAYAQALLDALHSPRAHRALDGYTLRDTAERYLNIAKTVFERNGIAANASIADWKRNESSM